MKASQICILVIGVILLIIIILPIDIDINIRTKPNIEIKEGQKIKVDSTEIYFSLFMKEQRRFIYYTNQSEKYMHVDINKSIAYSDSMEISIKDSKRYSKLHSKWMWKDNY